MRFLFKHRDRIFALLPGLLCKLHKKITKNNQIDENAIGILTKAKTGAIM